METLTAILATFALAGAPAADFHQGPEQVGQQVHVSGRIIGWQDDCALVLADKRGEAWQGLGGAGRFYWCDETYEKHVDAQGVQVGTRWARVGPRWRVLPVYEPAEGTP